MLNFLKNFLFIDQNSGKLSHTKFWSNVGYGALTYTFVYAVMYGTTVDIMIWALFGLVVVGNRTILQLFRHEGKGGKEDDKEGETG
jgi:hypothetical protein